MWIAGLVIVCCVHVLNCQLVAGFLNEACKQCEDQCINSALICDGQVNCADGSDEENCDFIKCRTPNYFQCQDSKCISVTQVCDKNADCSNGEDEIECDTRLLHDLGCTNSSFRCSNNYCIPEIWSCDGRDDCKDNSDETRGCEQKKCQEQEFQCRSKRCIPISYRCDGFYDCDDYSDEEHCDHKILDMGNCTSSNGKFACKDKLKCIDVFKTCDHISDCMDNSDEEGLCYDNNKACTNCTHECILTPDKVVCICHHGFILNNYNKCQDINECEEYGICDQKCLNTEGSYSCECDYPYKLQSDGRTCKMSDEDAVLFYSSSAGIKGVNLGSLRNFSLINYNESSPAVAVVDSYIYWIVTHQEITGIYRASTEDFKPHAIVTYGLGTPQDLDVDWITGNIYFTDSTFKHIGVCTNSGQICAVLHHSNIDKPRSISLAPENGLLFWTDWGSKPMIGKSGMDGSEPEIFVSENVLWPNDICTDTPNDRVYWMDAKREVIESIKFDGTDRRVILSDYIRSAFSISVFENKLYWSNRRGNEILECEKFTGKNKRSLIRDVSHEIYGVHIQHPKHNLRKTENPCASSPCTDLCLLAPGSKMRLHYSCACPDDKKLEKKSNTCLSKNSTQFLIAAFRNTAYLTEHQYLGHPQIRNIALNVESVSSMAYNSLKRQLIVADSKSSVIKAYDLNRDSATILPVKGINHVISMQYDDYGNNLYWCDWDTLMIEALSLNTFSRTAILSGNIEEVPLEIALVPAKGYMFVAFLIPYSSRVQIDRLSMDGSITSRSRFLDDQLVGPILKLYFDVSGKRLFWVDTSTGIIESVNENGEDRIFHLKSLDVADIMFMNNALFWTRKKSTFINWQQNSNAVQHINHIKLDIGEIYDDDEEIIITNPDNYVGFNSSHCLNNNGGCSDLCLVSNESPKKWVCACPIGHALAMDGLNCKLPQKCSSKQFTCYTGECISALKVCDKRKDCLHGEDESIDNCRQLCPEGQFLCHDRTKCIDVKLRCDGKFDCHDESDEVCHTNCTKGMFKCDNGECIESQFHCDGKVDCQDGFDEKNCREAKCENNQFKCQSGQCIPSAWFCDGENDCTDATDEIGNCTSSVCRRDEFHCTNDRCIEISMTCNGHDDCGDNSDEDKECIKNRNIYSQTSFYHIKHPTHVYKLCNSRTEFHCETSLGRHCIPISSRCNGVVNCLNGEDEQNCAPEKCAHENEFLCKNSGVCIPEEWVCDHHNDCGDNSDEMTSACLSKNFTKSECGGFRCGNGECITLSKVCNDIPDCSDKSDEGGLCGNGCEEARCSQKCNEDPKGPYCSCFHGFFLGSDNKTCHDIDECQLDICAQNCTNTPGSFVCSCFSSEYTLKSDHVSCKASGNAAHFITASLTELNIVTNNWMRTSRLLNLPSGSMITAIDVDNKKGVVYTIWDYSSIVKIDVLKLEISKIITPFIYGIAVDWITENIYFIQTRTKIMVTSFSTKKSSVIHDTENLVKILSIAADPTAGYLFWYESSSSGNKFSSGKMIRADCNGANIVNVTSTIEYTIENIAVDSYENHLYLYEKYDGIIIRMNYDGSNPSIVLRIESPVVGFSIFENSIYWASEDSDIYPIRKCKIYGLLPRKCEVIKSKFKNVRYFTMLQESRQRNVSNPCVPNVCSDVCTLSPTGPKCLYYNENHSSLHNNVQLPQKIESTSNFSTLFAYFVVLSLILALGIFGYRYFKPKSQYFHKFHFYNTPLSKSAPLYNSHASDINEIVNNKIGNAFLESVTEESIESEFISINHKTSRESLIKK